MLIGISLRSFVTICDCAISLTHSRHVGRKSSHQYSPSDRLGRQLVNGRIADFDRLPAGRDRKKGKRLWRGEREREGEDGCVEEDRKMEGRYKRRKAVMVIIFRLAMRPR